MVILVLVFCTRTNAARNGVPSAFFTVPVIVPASAAKLTDVSSDASRLVLRSVRMGASLDRFSSLDGGRVTILFAARKGCRIITQTATCASKGRIIHVTMLKAAVAFLRYSRDHRLSEVVIHVHVRGARLGKVDRAGIGAANTSLCLAAVGSPDGCRGHRQAREPYADRLIQGPWWSRLCRDAQARRPPAIRPHHGHTRQPWAIGGNRRQAGRHTGAHRRSRRQLGGEECRHGGIRRRINGCRARFR